MMTDWQQTVIYIVSEKSGLQNELSKFPNTNWFLTFLNKLLEKTDHAVNEAGCCVWKFVLVMYFKRQ